MRRLTATQDFETGTRGMVATLDVTWEPKFRPFYLETRPRNLVLHDAAGNPVAVSPAGSLLAPVDGKRAATADVSLPALKRPAAKIGAKNFSLIALASSGSSANWTWKIRSSRPSIGRNR